MRTIHLFFGATALTLLTVATDARAIPLPDYGTCNSNGPCLHVANSGSASGVLGTSTGGVGVLGVGTTGGVDGTSGGGEGVSGRSSTGTGVHGNSTYGSGVLATSWSGAGVYATSNSFAAVYASSSAWSAVDAHASGTNTAAIYGASSATGNGYGVLGTTAGTGPGIYGTSTGGGNAGQFVGNVQITGNLSATGSKSFVIDHPLDRDNKVLRHAAVESPEVKNIYDGVATMDAKGEAWVALPAYFEALNKDFRYQLTNIGGFAQTYIASEIQENRFKIAGGKPGLKVSWQVTGVRHDEQIVSHPMVVEEEKKQADRGSYLSPRKGERQLASAPSKSDKTH